MKVITKIILYHDIQKYPIPTNINSSYLYDILIKKVIKKYFNIDKDIDIDFNIKKMQVEWNIIAQNIETDNYESEENMKNLIDRGVNYIYINENDVNNKIKDMIRLKIKKSDIAYKPIIAIFGNDIYFDNDYIKENNILNNINNLWNETLSYINLDDGKTLIEKTKKINYVTIYHDTENCPFYDSSNSILLWEKLEKEVKQTIKLDYKNISSEIIFEWNLFVKKRDKLNHSYFPSEKCINDLLGNNYINYIYCGEKNSAVDMKMKDMLNNKIFDYNKEDSNELIVMITSDRDFGNEIRQLLVNNIPLLLIHNNNIRKSFIDNMPYNSCLNKWEDIIKRSSENIYSYNDSITNFDHDKLEILTCLTVPISYPEYIYYSNYNDYLNENIKKISNSFNVELVEDTKNSKYNILLQLYIINNDSKNKIHINNAIKQLNSDMNDIIITKYSDKIFNLNYNKISNDKVFRNKMKEYKILFYFKKENKTIENIYMKIPKVWLNTELDNNIKKYILENYNIQNFKIKHYEELDKIKYVKITLNSEHKKMLLQNKPNNLNIYFYELNNKVNKIEELYYIIIYNKTNEKEKNELLKYIQDNTDRIFLIDLKIIFTNNIKKMQYFIETFNYYNNLLKQKNIDCCIEDHKLKILCKTSELDDIINFIKMNTENFIEYKIEINDCKNSIELLRTIKEYLESLKKNPEILDNCSINENRIIDTIRFHINYKNRTNNSYYITLISCFIDADETMKLWKNNIEELIDNFTSILIDISNIQIDNNIFNNENLVLIKNKFNLSLIEVDNDNNILKINGIKKNIKNFINNYNKNTELLIGKTLIFPKNFELKKLQQFINKINNIKIIQINNNDSVYIVIFTNNQEILNKIINFTKYILHNMCIGM